MMEVDGSSMGKRQESRSDLVQELYLQFPGLLLQDRSFTSWSLATTTHGLPLLLQLHTPSFPSVQGAWVTGDARSEMLMTKERLEEVCRGSGSLAQLLERLLEVVQDATSPLAPPCLLAPGDVATSAAVLASLQEVGWSRVQGLAEDLSRAELVSQDGLHLLSITFPPSYPALPPSASHSLPPTIWSPPSLTLPLLLASWEKALDLLAPSWSALHELDRLCWVLDPCPPLPRHLYRRLVVASQVSLHLTLDPSSPGALPDLKLLGSEELVEPLRRALASNLELWEEEEPLLTNLEKVLEVELLLLLLLLLGGAARARGQ